MYKLLLCVRYLKTRYIALASIISVMLGVATMIVVNSVMSGFGSEMRDRIHGILADMVVETNSLDGIPDANGLMKLTHQAAGDYIAAMTPTVEIYGMLSFEYGGQWITRPVTLIGIEPESKAKVSPLVDHLGSYRPLCDGDKVIRPALRSHDQPPTWDLSEEAAHYRRDWVERQRVFLDRMRDENTISRGDSGDAPFPPGESRERQQADSVPPFTMSDAKTQTAVSPDGSGEASASNTSPDDPFAQHPFPAPADLRTPQNGPEAGSASPADPLPARLYVGSGLVEFTYEDRETGTMRTVHMVRPGDDVKISTISAGRPPEARHFNATVVDLFTSGMSEYDANLVFCNLEHLQEVRGMIDPSTGRIDPATGRVDPKTCVRSITSIQIKLKDYADADEVVQRLRAVFPPGTFSVRTWEQKQGPLLAAVEVESAILNVLLFLIIAVAGFGILAIFFMIVVEKTRDIGILKALGASSSGVMSIFLSYGLALGVVGSGVGAVLGLVFVRYINEIEACITWIIGRKVFDERIYYFPEIPTNVSPMMVIWVALGAMTIAVLASILPARRAARLHPVEALRYE